MFCQGCGRKSEDGWKFCVGCGRQLHVSAISTGFKSLEGPANRPNNDDADGKKYHVSFAEYMKNRKKTSSSIFEGKAKKKQKHAKSEDVNVKVGDGGNFQTEFII